MLHFSLTGLSRRNVLTLLATTVLSASSGWSSHVSANTAQTRPVLGTPEQIDAERTALVLLEDPDVKKLQAQLRDELAHTPAGQSRDGAALLDRAISQWTNSFLFKEIASYRATPAIIWGTDDTPHTWFGHTVGGRGVAGDNPDNIYRLTTIDGAGRYEIVGQIDVAHRPAQFSVEVVRGDAGPIKLKNQNKNHADMGNQIAMLTDRDLTIAADGSFRITLGAATSGELDGPNHVTTETGTITVGFRDTLSDWNQRPGRLEIHRLDDVKPKAFDRAELKKRVLAKLGDYVQFWGSYTDSWFGGLKQNDIAGPVPRDGGWGFVSGIRFKLEPGEALLVTTTRGGADYTGFQVIDPWLIAPDARHYQSSLNLAQSTPDADGSYTYLISPTDPGIANWLDSAGVSEGYAVIRWQGMPAGVRKEQLVRNFRIVRIADVAKLSGVALTTAQQRRVQLAAREPGYTNRLR